jgi:transcription initiation factor TFIIH subunit 2
MISCTASTPAICTADMRPVRSAVMSGILQQFVRAFFDENPLSQLGLIVMRNGVAERLTELSSSPVGGWRLGRFSAC